MATRGEGPVTGRDIQAKLEQIKGQVDTAATTVKPYALAAAAAGGVMVLGLTFLLGVRKGKKKTTVVEVRRV